MRIRGGLGGHRGGEGREGSGGREGGRKEGGVRCARDRNDDEETRAFSFIATDSLSGPLSPCCACWIPSVNLGMNSHDLLMQNVGTPWSVSLWVFMLDTLLPFSEHFSSARSSSMTRMAR